jgi:hypothetical protein
MADLVREEDVGLEVSVASSDELVYTFPGDDRERILSHLNSRTTAEIRRELALRRAAEARLAKQERRCSVDRRSGRERRAEISWIPSGGERRSGNDRRSSRDRRATSTA